MSFFKIFSPLIKYPNYRLLFLGQMVSFFGTMMSYISVPYQVFHVTHSSYMVGLLGIFELSAVLIFSLWGGVVADRYDRKEIVIYSEIVMIISALLLFLNSLQDNPNPWIIFGAVFSLMGANSFHRPAMEAMVQKMVDPADFPYASSLKSMLYSIGAILGPTVGGYLTGTLGVQAAYGIDLLTFAISLTCLFILKGSYNADHEAGTELPHPYHDVKDGLSYAKKNQVLLGTYFVDIVAMVFAYPVVLFPMLLPVWKMNDTFLGYPMAAIAIGSLVAGALGGPLSAKIAHKGRVVGLAAFVWGLFIVGLGMTTHFYLALFFLFLSGVADGTSGVFRSVIWNEIIPNKMRGRLASIEMISYMSGPLLGNFRAGTFAGFFELLPSIAIGGVLCSVGVALVLLKLPLFWQYSGVTKDEGNA